MRISHIFNCNHLQNWAEGSDGRHTDGAELCVRVEAPSSGPAQRPLASLTHSSHYKPLTPLKIKNKTQN